MTRTPAKSAIVTGASRGISRAIAKRLSREGFSVVVNYTGSVSEAKEATVEIQAAGGQAVAVQADVSDAADVERLFKQTVDTYGRDRHRGEQRRDHAAAADRFG